MELPLFTVDSFSRVPFEGNPAAVCMDITLKGLSDGLMQKIASEMNISETAFVRVLTPGEDAKTSRRFALRWFTPSSEVPLCGHATLAAAAVLFQTMGNESDQLEFSTRESGVLLAKRTSDTQIGLVLPLNNPHHIEEAGFTDLIQLCVCGLPVKDLAYSAVTKKLLIRLDDTVTRTQLEQIDVRIAQLTACEVPRALKGVMVTLKGGGPGEAEDAQGRPYDFISRYFAPWVGIPEDPVTGAAHTVLAGYWACQLQKTTLYARQCSARGGDLSLSLREDGRLDVSGQATIVLKGNITVPQQ